MDLSNLLLIGALAVAILAFAYLFVGARRLSAARRRRVEAQAVAQAAAAPAPAAADADTPSPYLPEARGDPDDLMRIKGIGPKLAARLKELGVFHYWQIAGWSAAQLAIVDAELGQFQGRPARDRWQDQARLLASGDLRAFERMHGKLGPDPAGGPPA